LPGIFGRRRRQRGRLKEGGKSLEGSFPNKNAAGGSFRGDFGRTSPVIQCRYPGSAGARLCKPGPQVLQQPGQELPVRISRGQVHPEAAAGFPQAGPDLQQLEPQGIDLGGFQLGALQMAAQTARKVWRSKRNWLARKRTDHPTLGCATLASLATRQPPPPPSSRLFNFKCERGSIIARFL
jgi:hypothetical protein